MLDTHCDYELWPWIFKVNFWNSCISGTGGSINIEWKGYESIAEDVMPSMWPWAMIWPWVLKVKFWQSSILGVRGWIDMEPKGCELIGCWTQVVTLTSTMTLILDFRGEIFNSHILGMGGSIDLEWKRCELDTMLDAQWACSWAWQIDRPSNGSVWISYSFQPVGPWMGYSFTDLGAERCCRSLNALLSLFLRRSLIAIRNASIQGHIHYKGDFLQVYKSPLWTWDGLMSISCL